MKRILLFLVLTIAVLLSGCEMLYPMQNSPTPSITCTPEPTVVLVPTTDEVIPTAQVTPEVLYTAEPTEDIYAGLEHISPTVIEVSHYMADNYYKAGDGFRDAIDVRRVTSSCFLAPQAGNSNIAENLYDFDLDTVWCEGRSSYGVGEWVEYSVRAFDYAPSAVITKLEIINGYIKNDDAFYGNSMARKVLVSLNDEDVCILDFVVSKDIQVFDIPDIGLATTISKVLKFEILEVYEGEKYKDTCITAIEFDGTGIY